MTSSTLLNKVVEAVQTQAASASSAAEALGRTLDGLSKQIDDRAQAILSPKEDRR
jgi:hypothetical protein